VRRDVPNRGRSNAVVNKGVMAAKMTTPHMSSRRATQLCIQRLITTPTEARATLPSMSSGIGHNSTALKLPNFLSPMTATSATSPSCVHCDATMAWVHWYEDAHTLSIGLGKFHSRCALCRANDASFKDGPPC